MINLNFLTGMFRAVIPLLLSILKQTFSVRLLKFAYPLTANRPDLQAWQSRRSNSKCQSRQFICQFTGIRCGTPISCFLPAGEGERKHGQASTSCHIGWDLLTLLMSFVEEKIQKQAGGGIDFLALLLFSQTTWGVTLVGAIQNIQYVCTSVL